MADELLFLFHGLPQIGVEGALGNIAVHMDERVAVPLALDAAFALGQVPGPPGAVQVVHGDETVLDIGARPHLLCTSHQDAHLARAHFGKQLFLLRLGVGLMDEGDLLFRDAAADKFAPQVVIDSELPGSALGRGDVAEYQLGQLVCRSSLQMRRMLPAH